ncbi:unnamed protein product [Alternaria alternata]
MAQQRQAAEAFHRQQQAQQAQQAQAHAQAQAQAQARLEQQRQQQAAQARNQQNQLLQGQIEDSTSPEVRNKLSPAMPMLNRPMPPPGQSGPPGTPQQQRPLKLIAAAVQAANQQPLTDQVRMNMMPADLDPETLKPATAQGSGAQFRVILQSYMMNLRRSNGMQNGAFPPGQPNAGQPNMPFNQQQQLPPGMTGQMLGGPNMPNMVRPGMNLGQPQPGAGPQPPMGAQRPPMPSQQQRLQDCLQLVTRANPGIIHATDPKPFPPNVLNNSIRNSPSPGPAHVQVLHFQDMVRQSGGVGGVHPTPQPGHGLAPPVQVNANQGPIRTPQQQQNMPNMAALQVTPQDLQQFRARMAGSPQANLPDEQLRGFMISLRMKNLQQQRQQQAQSAMLNQQAQRNQAQPPVNMPIQQHQPNRPPTAQPPTQATPQPKAAARPQPQSQPMQLATSNNAGNKGTKRPNGYTSLAMMPRHKLLLWLLQSLSPDSTLPIGGLTTPAQQTQYKAQLLKAQDPHRTTRCSNKEVVWSTTKNYGNEWQIRQGHDTSAADAVPLQRSLKEQLHRLKQVDQALRIFHASYDSSEPEQVLRQIMASRVLLYQQFDQADGTLHPQVTLTIEEFKNHMGATLKFVAKIMEKVKQQSAASQRNLRVNNKTAARRLLPPLPPTVHRLPSELIRWHGAAHYFEGARPVTNLVLPEKKRPEELAGSETSTPEPPPNVPQRPTFRCNDASCEYSVRGFDTQAELEAHSQIHAKVENPMQFALDSMADYLDIDQKTGEAKVDQNAAKRASKPVPAAPQVPQQPVKPGQTPGASHSAATPVGQQATATAMARVPTQTGVKDSPSSNLLKTPQAMTKEQQATAPEPVPKEEEQKPQQPMLPMSLLDYSYEDTFAALDANGPFTVMDLKDEDHAWTLRSRPASPSATPESSNKDTPSTRQSDISGE